jgi:hypothetical protein
VSSFVLENSWAEDKEDPIKSITIPASNLENGKTLQESFMPKFHQLTYSYANILKKYYTTAAPVKNMDSLDPFY